MKHYDPDIDRWLAAEAVDDQPRAEAALIALLARLPRLAPGAFFAERVLTAAPFVIRRAVPALWGWQWAIAGTLVATGVAVWLLPALRWLPLETPRLANVVKAWAVTTSAVLEWIQGGVAVWSFFLQCGRWVAVAIQAPEIAAGLVASAVLSGTALYTLNHLLSPERSTW